MHRPDGLMPASCSRATEQGPHAHPSRQPPLRHVERLPGDSSKPRNSAYPSASSCPRLVLGAEPWGLCTVPSTPPSPVLQALSLTSPRPRDLFKGTPCRSMQRGRAWFPRTSIPMPSLGQLPVPGRPWSTRPWEGTSSQRTPKLTLSPASAPFLPR